MPKGFSAFSLGSYPKIMKHSEVKRSYKQDVYARIPENSSHNHIEILRIGYKDAKIILKEGERTLRVREVPLNGPIFIGSDPTKVKSTVGILAATRNHLDIFIHNENGNLCKERYYRICELEV